MFRVGWLVIALALASSSVAADAPTEAPWVRGVAAEKRRDAMVEFKAGNDAFLQSRYTDALAGYERALALWDQPQIQYNAALCLIQLSRPIEAYDRIVRSLVYGEAPFEGDLYQRALISKKLLRAQLAELTVEVTEAGAQIAVDGKPLDRGIAKMFVAGPHVIVVAKPGFETQTKQVELRPDSTNKIPFDLKPPAPITLRRRWASWKPWAIVVGGAVAAGGGAAFHVRALKQFGKYDDVLEQACPGGCPEGIPDEATSLQRSATSWRGLAIGSYAVAGSALVTGVVLLVLNREVAERRSVAIVRIGDGHGLALGGRF